MDRILSGARPVHKPYLGPPQRVANRASTDILIATDVLVQKAIRLIRQLATKGLSAKELVQQLGVSRTRMENLFRHELHQTVHEVLTKRRLAEASRMHLHTSLTQAAIAAQCGFVDNSHFSRLFHKSFGTTPGQHRPGHTRANR